MELFCVMHTAGRPANIKFSLLPLSRAEFGFVCCGQSIAPESAAACCVSAARNLRRHFSRLRVDKSAINFIFRRDKLEKDARSPAFVCGGDECDTFLTCPQPGKAGVCVTCKIRSN